ncbi:MAG: hypothetical protein JWO19_5292 [Bryobacterales bacterium]|nr:hypothetical protein [Bryobacterales bacterium]
MTSPIPSEQPKNTPETATTKARVAKRRPRAAPIKAKSASEAGHTKKPGTARHGTKTAKILELLKRPAGVTLKDLMKIAGWQAHSVRGFLSGTLRKKMGTSVESFQNSAGKRAYRVSIK